jgi:hypothetical protein
MWADRAKMISRTHLNVPFIIASGDNHLAAEELPGNAMFVPKPSRMQTIAAMVGERDRRSRAFPRSLGA